MSAKAKIILFIVVFCVLLGIPFVANAVTSHDFPELSLDTPEINALSEKKCVESAEVMSSSHMQMLNDWRDDVLRRGDTEYISSSGQVYEKSLDDTCLRCHSNKEEFCDTCHTYENVEPYCWDCHDPDAELPASD
ncbi:MAG: sulfate reduction electron transfer complex DsrMKJOP subunit DsrJ [Eggerthellaceae bacterium]|nr:sulfate reduction electron transfer complex DsrMKJOP subunit DsrJ [Eggerthellaceae bacterium]